MKGTDMDRYLKTGVVIMTVLWAWVGLAEGGVAGDVAARMCQAYQAEAARNGPQDRQALQSLVAECQTVAQQAKGQVAVVAKASFVALANARMGLLFQITDTGADLKAIYQAQKDYQFLRWVMGTRPLWQVEYLKAGQWTGPLDSTLQAQVKSRHWSDDQGAHVEITWDLPSRQLAVKMHVKLAEGENLSHWFLEVTNGQRDTGIGRIAFPMVRGMGLADTSTRDFLAIPQKSGWIYRDPGHTADYYQSPAMQYFCYYTAHGNGLYVDTADGEGIPKQLAGLADSGTVASWFEYTVGDAGVPGRNYSLQARVGVFEGDWYDGSRIYREWALKQKWVPKAKFHERPDIPQWMKENCVTIRAQGDPREAVVQGKQWNSTYSVPATFNWYSWADTATLTAQCPDVVSRPGFKDAVAELNQMGLRVVAYSMFRLWDTSLPGWKKEGGAQASQRDEYGELLWGRYDGNPLAYACPMAQIWRKKYTDAVLRLVRDYGIKGIYADLAGTWVAETCYCADHGHPVGGGGWFGEAEAEMLNQVRREARKIDPEFIILAESNDERVIGAHDAYLIYQGLDVRKITAVPMFQVVYGDYAKSYGAKSSSERSGVEQNLARAQVLVWGGQIGRVGSDLSQKGLRQASDALMKYARLRQAAMAYLGRGTMERPLKLTVEGAETLDPIDVALSVEQATYRAPDGSLGFVFASTRSRDRRTVVFELDPEIYGVPSDGQWSLYWMDSTGSVQPARKLDGKVTMSVAFAPREAKVLIARPSQEINP